MGQFDYSSFFEDKKSVTLGEVQQYFGFLSLGDLRKIVNSILAFQGVQQEVKDPIHKILLVQNRAELILDGIIDWQKGQEKTLLKKFGRRTLKTKEENKLVSVNKVPIKEAEGLTFIDFTCRFPSVTNSTQWASALNKHPEWFNMVGAGLLKSEYLDKYVDFCLNFKYTYSLTRRK